MRTERDRYRKRFLNSPYMFILCTLANIGFIVAAAGLYYIQLLQNGFDMKSLFKMPLYAHLLIWISLLSVEAAMFWNRYEYFGILLIKENCLEFRTLLAHRYFYYDDIHFIGIDYGVIQGQKEFWIFYSKEPIPFEYYHNMQRVKYTKKTMRSRFSEELFASLCYYLPNPLSKELARQYSVIRANKK